MALDGAAITPFWLIAGVVDGAEASGLGTDQRTTEGAALAGQTCIAPDYSLVKREVAASLLSAMCAELRRQLPRGALVAGDYPRITSEAHFDRICGLMKNAEILIGGKIGAKTRRIELTVILLKGRGHPSIREEILGLILPLIVVSDIDEAFSLICEETVVWGCRIDDIVIQLAEPGFDFWWIGKSGIGGYRGKHGFGTFSHRMRVTLCGDDPELLMHYRPYGP